MFTAHGDIGGPTRPGAVRGDLAQGRYRVSGGGSNMWFGRDAFHFVWKQVSGDVEFAADIAFLESEGDPHRKAVLMVRQSLDPDSAYADAALHADGLTSLQYREERGAPTREIQSGVRGPRRLRIEKRGRYVSMSVAREGESLTPAGGAFRLDLRDPFLVGLGVCSHNDAELRTAEFSGVELVQTPAAAGPPAAGGSLRVLSVLETVQVGSKDRRVTWWTTNLIEAPNWSPDGRELVFNSRGRLYRIPVEGGEPREIDTGFAVRNNNDHGFSPDGRWLAISDQSEPDRRSRIHVVSAGGGTPRTVVEGAPSYWHGWSPDGRWLVYCAERNGEYDVYAAPVTGGAETRLTTAKGLDDGPDFSPDGRFIYFNSDRTGRMQIWRMRPDGSGQEQVTRDGWNDWFPHPSPDGRWLVFLSYGSEVKGHPANQDVQLRLMSLTDGTVQVLAKLFGGQGTLNVPSWSPDSRRVAFVSYQPVR